MADQSYLDRLYNEIGQYGDRIKATFGGSGGYRQIADNWGATYQPSYSDSVAEQNRLRLQQAKEEYDLQANAGKLSEEEAFQKQAILESIGQSIQQLERRTGMPTPAPAEIMQQQAAMQPPAAVDPYAQYLQENREVLKNPEYAAPTREEFQKHFVEKQAPPKAVAVSPAVAEMAASMPRQAQPSAMPAPAGMPQEIAPQQQPGRQRPMTIRDQINALPYEADRLDATRKVIQQTRLKTYNDGLKYVAQTYGIETPQGQNALKTIKDSIDENLPLPKPVEETAQYKGAEKNWGDLRDTQNRISKVTGQVEEAQRLMAIDKQAALAHMKANLIKPLNSILSNDAIQLQEMIVRFSDLLSGSELAQIAGKGIFNPSTLFNKYLTLQDADKKNFIEKFTSALSEANPERFLNTAINGVNGYINRYNTDLTNQVINPTSPTIAKQLGAVLIPPLQSNSPQEDLPATYPAGVPVPTQQKSAVPLDIEAMRSRYKR